MISPKKFARFLNSLTISSSSKASSSPNSAIDSPSVMIETPIESNSKNDYPKESEDTSESYEFLEKMNIKGLRTLLFDFKSEFSVESFSELTLESTRNYFIPKILQETSLSNFWKSVETRGEKVCVYHIFIFLASKTMDTLDNKLAFCANFFENNNGVLDYEAVTDLFSSIASLHEMSISESTGKNDRSLDAGEKRRKSFLSGGASIKALNNNSIYSSINLKLRANSAINISNTTSIDNSSNENLVSVDPLDSKSIGARNALCIYSDMKMDSKDYVTIENVLQWTHRFPHRVVCLGNLQQNRMEKSRIFISKEEKRMVRSILESHEAKIGTTYQIISSKWWQSWAEYVGFYKENDSKNGDDVEISPPLSIDNVQLLRWSEDEATATGFKILRKDIIEGLDYIIIPKEVGYCLENWYGGGPAIYRESYALRKRHQITEDKGNRVLETHRLVNVRLDLFPLIIDIGLYMDMRTSAKCIVGGFQSFKELTTIICIQFGLDISKNYELFVMKSGSTDAKLLEEVPNFTINDYVIEGGILIREATSVFISKEKSLTSPIIETTSDLKSGIVGLENLGNTCYMNASLQVLSQIRCFSNYFMFDKYVMDGEKSPELELVYEFSNFIKQYWTASEREIVAPRTLRAVIAKVFPEFGGFAQHDAQEFLSMFLDHIHESLNRIKRKEYPSNPDWKGEDEREFSETFWKNHLKVNESILVPLFHGQLKNVVECSVCRKQSVTFDPFLFLTLPIPSLKFRTLKVLIVHLGKGPVQSCLLSVPVDGTAQEIVNAWKATKKEDLQNRHYIIADVQNHYIFHVIKKTKSMSTIREKDEIALFEYTVPKKGNFSRFDSEINISKSGLAGKKIYGRVMRVHIIHRRIKEEKWRRGSKTNLIGIPMVTMMDASLKENLSGDCIYNFVKERLENLFSVDVLNMITDLSKVQHEIPGRPFVIRATNRMGTECRLCEEKNCIGCIINPDTDIDIGWDDTFCVDWRYSKSKFDFSSVLEKVSKVDFKAPKTDKISLRDCLNRFNMPEIISQDQWNCSKCKGNQTAVKQINIYRAPLVLIIHLNRFSQTLWSCLKNESLIDFPLVLDLSEHIKGDDECKSYNLKGIINHSGDLQEGHYTTTAWNENKSTWFYFDDSDVYDIQDPSMIVSSSNYILFYERKDVKTEFQIRCKQFLSTTSNNLQSTWS